MNEQQTAGAAGESGPYAGLLVVTLEQAVAAPTCSCHFAEGGARVIKIERAGGDFARNYDSVVKGESSYFVWANHGKESLELDIKSADDAELLHRILAEADVFIQNLAPGAASRAGFDSEELRARHPRLITCDISGYGEDGAYRDMKAYDFLVQCESGLVAINGSPEGYGRIGVSICDIGAGMNAVIGIQQALLKRERSGRGSGVRISLFDTAADWMTVPLMHAQYGGRAPQRVGLHHPSIAPYGGYATSDGEILAISIQNEREWQRLCTEILEQPELADDPRFHGAEDRVQNRKALDVYIEAVFGAATRQVLEARLRKAGIAYGAVNSVESFIAHPQLRRRPVSLPDGQEADLVAPAIRSSFEDSTRFRPVPAFGEHTDAIRSEFSRLGSRSASAT
ncbi:MAG: CaiB/BaiF CoA-transferase family protein [Halieaceae bacterium]|jgi:crotonobetainyl-CoA:carnitine CoA-transferase CaiB-like acyl-CoA transferase|nr:CaiB/BaiF CoA-transferase family protein [Halieaceae bacterium]